MEGPRRECQEEDDGRGPVGRCMRPIEACCSDETNADSLSSEAWAQYIDALLEAMDEIQDEEFAWAARQKQCLVAAGLARIHSITKDETLRGKALEALVIVCGVVPEGYLKIWSDGFAGSIAARIARPAGSGAEDAECHQPVDQHTPYALAALVELCCWAENEPSSSASSSSLEQLVNTEVVSGAVELLGSGEEALVRGATLVIAHLASLSLALSPGNHMPASPHSSPSPHKEEQRRAPGLEGRKEGVGCSASDQDFTERVRTWVGTSGFLAAIHQHRFGLYVGENAIQLLNRTQESSSQRALLRLVLALLSEDQEAAKTGEGEGGGSEAEAGGACVTGRGRRSLMYDGDVLVLAEIVIRIGADSGKDWAVQCLAVVAVGAVARQLDLKAHAGLRAEMQELLSALMESSESHARVRSVAERVLMDGIHLFDPGP